MVANLKIGAAGEFLGLLAAKSDVDGPEKLPCDAALMSIKLTNLTENCLKSWIHQSPFGGAAELTRPRRLLDVFHPALATQHSISW